MQKSEFHIYTLPNGIRGIHRQVRGNVVHCALTTGAGSRDELAGEYGLAHFTEHGFFKGTGKRRAYQVNCRLENLGGELNAFTTKEETTLHATVLRSDFAKAAELIADVAFGSVFPDREMEKEREVICDEINTYKDSPADAIYDSFEELLFEGSEIGHNILGDKRSVMHFTGDDIRTFMRRTYTTDRMVFSSVGNISPEAAERTAMRYLGTAAPSQRAFDRTVPPLNEPFDKCLNKHTHQVHCITGCRAYGTSDKRRLQLALLINILGGPSANSRLNVTVREKYGLSYNIEASYTPYCDSGMAAIYFSSDKINAQRCMELVDAEIERLRREPLTARRLSMAKKQFIAQLAISMESNEGYMLGAGRSLLAHGRVDTFEEVCRKIDAVTAGQLVETAGEVLTGMSRLTYK
ncbi:MAG: insulinase family protein [Alistipes sp.]|nr:insulinase family protein [Alistipes sp.]